MAYWPRNRVQPYNLQPYNLGLLATQSRSTFNLITFNLYTYLKREVWQISQLLTL
ncbi:MAG: hypothetical protein F6K50_28795 [Moorea sp. SIO3I7]|uniref:hypothetical protein n=1 Tax=unclassified Moorena TaxID=2683338 RepID=UPI0013BD80D8|nr:MULTISPECIES: hypothetical protein [unclassified Moorena]NEN99340.1 hypothetical protein [Moorena sp. SIO3I7]NEO95710.1 hypothetical protein [Moorena sp. SIO3G5]NEO07850.1 hypothetical protein [Moorena sp. SIO3I8]NEO22002.1 hypothetical protein [Moorena sp. SIO4A5]NEO41721.1 hypothetical protein [Moorena sp. SIOASIH]